MNVINISKCHLVLLAPLISHRDIFSAAEIQKCNNRKQLLQVVHEIRCTYYFPQSSYFFFKVAFWQS